MVITTERLTDAAGEVMFRTERLMSAADEGEINELYKLLGQDEDPSILDYYDRVPFSETPLHRAASGGKTHFAMEIMMLKPSFAKKLNQNGLSPIHLASTNGHVMTVKGLLAMDKDLARIKGREGKTPVHCASLEGKNDVLLELLRACPDSITKLTLRRETALHLAVENGKFETFEFLWKAVECLLTSAAKKIVLNWKDDNGNTILHLATKKKQRQTIELLLRSPNVVEVNAVNTNDQTCLYILLSLPAEGDKEGIQNILRRAGTKRFEDIQFSKYQGK